MHRKRYAEWLLGRSVQARHSKEVKSCHGQVCVRAGDSEYVGTPGLPPLCRPLPPPPIPVAPHSSQAPSWLVHSSGLMVHPKTRSWTPCAVLLYGECLQALCTLLTKLVVAASLLTCILGYSRQEQRTGFAAAAVAASPLGIACLVTPCIPQISLQAQGNHSQLQDTHARIRRACGNSNAVRRAHRTPPLLG